MLFIVIGLFVCLIIFVVVVSSIRQLKEKQQAEKRARIAKQKLLMDENEQLLLQLSNLPCSQNMYVILHKRSLNAALRIQDILPSTLGISNKVDELSKRVKQSEEAAKHQSANFDETFTLPDDDKQLIGLLQCIKKVRLTLKSEHAKGAIDPVTYNDEENRYSEIQLKINVETNIKRGIQAKNKGLNGSARQFFDKCLTTLAKYPKKNEYATLKQDEVKELLNEINETLKNTPPASNTEDKSLDENVDELDLMFQPKKKW
jgi:hypothetical protein